MDQKITVLHIAECAGGVERYIQMLLPRLEKKGFCQFFICSYNYNKTNYQGMVDGVKQMDSLSIPTWVYTENSSDRGPGFFVTLKARLGSHGYAKTESGFVVGPAITAVISAKDAKSFESDISKEFCDYFGAHWNQEEILQLIPESGPNESTNDMYRALCLASFHQPKLWDMTGRPLKRTIWITMSRRTIWRLPSISAWRRTRLTRATPVWMTAWWSTGS